MKSGGPLKHRILCTSAHPFIASLVGSAFCRFWRKLLEHLGNALVQVLLIFLGLIGQSVFSTSPPNQLLRLCVVQVNNQGPFLVVLLRGCGFAHSTESSPPPTSPEPVIERLQC